MIIDGVSSGEFIEIVTEMQGKLVWIESHMWGVDTYRYSYETFHHDNNSSDTEYVRYTRVPPRVLNRVHEKNRWRC